MIVQALKKQRKKWKILNYRLKKAIFKSVKIFSQNDLKVNLKKNHFKYQFKKTL